MSYMTLMVYVDADGMPEQRVRLSATLADKFNATLIGMSAIARISCRKPDLLPHVALMLMPGSGAPGAVAAVR